MNETHMNRISSESLQEALLRLRNTEPQVMDLGKRLCAASGGDMFTMDLLAIAAMKRTCGNTEGFITLVEARNMAAARSLLRIQIDTFIRFSAAWLVDNPHDFATDVIEGKHIRNMRDKSSQKMTDSYLVDVLTPDYPWLKEVYRNLCGYVHFSGAHLSNAVSSIDDEGRTMTFNIGEEDSQYPDWSWIETVDCFTKVVHIFLRYADGWILTKDDERSTSHNHPTNE